MGAVEGLPAQLKSLIQGPLTVPLTNMYERLLLITYLDDELLVSSQIIGTLKEDTDAVERSSAQFKILKQKIAYCS